MNFRKNVLVVISLFLVASIASYARPARATSWTLDQVLDQLTREAKTFESLSARVDRTKVTVVVNDRSTESGEMYVRRDGKMLLDLTQPDNRTILRVGDDLYIYNPQIKQVEEYNLAKHRDLVDQLLLLGFGTPAHLLKKAYGVALGGEQTLGDRKTVLLELIPKTEEVRNQISKIQLWVDESTWLPVQQKFFESGSQDYFVIRYSNVVRNALLKASTFKPHWPKGTKKVKPQG